MVIKVHYDIEKFRLRDSKALKRVIGRIIADSGMKPGTIDLVFTGDRKVYEINSEFLGHDFYTDVITFNYNSGKTVNGEIYISTDRVRENAEKFNVPFGTELKRVVFHGILHLCGYDDSTAEQKAKMTEMEEMYLAISYSG
ncbi:MAG: rRNA maturation RNase YbeY [Bacteroidales bacterium]|nr:rRNA maturation RNase YbeY [Bacteroidales bacterium]